MDRSKKDKMKKYKNILVTNENYKLKKLGNAGDSFNFVITKLLNRNKKLQSGDGVRALNQITTE